MLNAFLSNIEFFDSTQAAFEQNEAYVYQLLIDTYKNQNVPIEPHTGKQIIDGLEFSTIEIKIYKNNKLIMTQKMYNRLINNYIFSMTIVYGNEKDKAILEKIVTDSKFKK